VAAENGSEQRAQMETEMLSICLLLVNPWAQVRNQCISAKAVSWHVPHTHAQLSTEGRTGGFMDFFFFYINGVIL
jgi:hypothetical protein